MSYHLNLHSSQLRTATLCLIDKQQSSVCLSEAMSSIRTLISTADNSNLDQHQESKETTHNLILSPMLSSSFSQEITLSIQFIRAAHAAINDCLNNKPNQPVNILSVGCSAYAIPAISLMSVFPSSQLSFTFIDQHQDSIDSIQKIIQHFGFSKQVKQYLTMDAMQYQVDTESPPDLVLLETIQDSLGLEPLVPISCHILAQVENTILIPEQISLDLFMLRSDKEFSSQVKNISPAQYHSHRIHIAPVFIFNKKTFQPNNAIGEYLPAERIQIPDNLSENQTVIFFTKLTLYKGHHLEYFESDLSADFSTQLKAGDEIQFYYKFTFNPRLIAINQSELHALALTLKHNPENLNHLFELKNKEAFITALQDYARSHGYRIEPDMIALIMNINRSSCIHRNDN